MSKVPSRAESRTEEYPPIPRRQVALSALAMVATSVLVAGGGMVFWLSAGRTSEAANVALASAVLSGTTFAALLGGAGLAPALATALPHAARPGRFALRAVLTASAAAACTAMPLAWWASKDSTSQNDAVLVFLAAVTAALLAAGAAVDALFVHQDRTRFVLARNALASLSKIPPAATIPLNAVGLLAAVAGALVLSGVAALGLRRNTGRQVSAHGQDTPGPRQRPTGLRTLLSHHVVTVALSAPPLLGPVILVGALGADAFAPYFPTWVVLSTYTAGATSVTTAFLSHRARGERGQLRRNGALLVLVGVAASSPLAFAALCAVPLVLGPQYATVNVLAVGLLMASVPLLVAFIAAGAVLRVRGRMTSAVTLSTAYAVVMLSTLLVLAHQGPVWTSVAFCVQTGIGAGVAVLMAWNKGRERTLRRRYRREQYAS